MGKPKASVAEKKLLSRSERAQSTSDPPKAQKEKKRKLDTSQLGNSHATTKSTASRSNRATLTTQNERPHGNKSEPTFGPPYKPAGGSYSIEDETEEASKKYLQLVLQHLEYNQLDEISIWIEGLKVQVHRTYFEIAQSTGRLFLELWLYGLIFLSLGSDLDSQFCNAQLENFRTNIAVGSLRTDYLEIVASIMDALYEDMQKMSYEEQTHIAGMQLGWDTEMDEDNMSFSLLRVRPFLQMTIPELNHDLVAELHTELIKTISKTKRQHLNDRQMQIAMNTLVSGVTQESLDIKKKITTIVNSALQNLQAYSAFTSIADKNGNHFIQRCTKDEVAFQVSVAFGAANPNLHE